MQHDGLDGDAGNESTWCDRDTEMRQNSSLTSHFSTSLIPPIMSECSAPETRREELKPKAFNTMRYAFNLHVFVLLQP